MATTRSGSRWIRGVATVWTDRYSAIRVLISGGGFFLATVIESGCTRDSPGHKNGEFGDGTPIWLGVAQLELIVIATTLLLALVASTSTYQLIRQQVVDSTRGFLPRIPMSDGCREQLGWKVSAELWARFEGRVASEWGGTSQYTGIQIEQSWREYHSDGGRHPLEEVSEEIVVATGRSPSDVREKSLRTGINVEAETTTVWVRVHEDVKAEMAAFANASHVPKRAVLRAVLTWYLEGGKDDRVLEKLESVVDDIEAAFESFNGDNNSLSKTERTTRAIATRLEAPFSEWELAEAIDAETSGSDYYHSEYSPRVIEFMGVKCIEHDDGPDAFLPLEQWQNWKAGEIIDALGGDSTVDVAPPFTKQDFLEAANQAGFDQAETSDGTLDRILDRLDFRWNETDEQFELMTDGDDEISTSGNSTSGSTVD